MLAVNTTFDEDAAHSQVTMTNQCALCMVLHTHTLVPELYHHWVEWSMLSAILPSSQVSGVQNGNDQTSVYTAVLSSVQLEKCDGYQMMTNTGVQRLTLMT